MHYVYILKCVDNSYYIGSTSDLEHRLAEHQAGLYKGYTSKRLPVHLVWSQEFPTEHEAFITERHRLRAGRRPKKRLSSGAIGMTCMRLSGKSGGRVKPANKDRRKRS